MFIRGSLWPEHERWILAMQILLWFQVGCREVPAVSRMVDILRTGKSDPQKKKGTTNKKWQAKDPWKETASCPQFNGTLHILWEGLVTTHKCSRAQLCQLRSRGERKRLEPKHHCVE